jgi:hypothetical protein
MVINVYAMISTSRITRPSNVFNVMRGIGALNASIKNLVYHVIQHSIGNKNQSITPAIVKIHMKK